MVGASVLPACIHKGKLYFLFGKENSLADTPGWADFGGGVDPGENILESAMREGGEELTGFLGGEKEMRALIRKNGGYLPMSYDTYHIHLFHLPYEPLLPYYYNLNHEFLWKRMNKQFLTDTKLFEKIEIRWFSVDDMRRNRGKFRNFYRNIVDMLLKKEKEIRAFLKHGKGKTMSKIKSSSRKTRKNTRRG
jgi:hypothetical protein